MLPGQLISPSPHRLGNVLESLRSHVVEGDIDLATDLSIGVIGQADPAGLGNALKASGDIDAVAEDIIVVDDDVSDVYPNAELDPEVLRHTVVLFSHAVLDSDRTARSIHRASEFNQHAVAGGFDDPAAMGGDGGVDEGRSNRFEPGQRAFLVDAHEAAIPGDIRRQHRCQSPVHALGGQRMPLDWSFLPHASKHIRPLLD